MNVTFRCRNCNTISREQYAADTTRFTCPACQTAHEIPRDAITGDATGQNVVTRCMVCPGKELYFRKQFNQRLGITIIGLGFAASTIAYYYHHLLWVYGILFFTAGIDLLFYIFTGNLLQCYKCNSEYRGFEDSIEYEPFNLEIHEKYHQQRVRLEREQQDAKWLATRASDTTTDETPSQ
jgi:hypothetical protein